MNSIALLGRSLDDFKKYEAFRQCESLITSRRNLVHLMGQYTGIPSSIELDKGIRCTVVRGNRDEYPNMVVSIPLNESVLSCIYRQFRSIIFVRDRELRAQIDFHNLAP